MCGGGGVGGDGGGGGRAKLPGEDEAQHTGLLLVCVEADTLSERTERANECGQLAALHLLLWGAGGAVRGG